MATNRMVRGESCSSSISSEKKPLLLNAINCKSKNSCASKSSATLGMIDIALLSANATQLKYVLRLGERHEFYYIVVGLISASIIVQAVACLINVILGCLININDGKQEKTASNVNNTVLALDGVITIINVLITAFDVHQ